MFQDNRNINPNKHCYINLVYTVSSHVPCHRDKLPGGRALACGEYRNTIGLVRIDGRLLVQHVHQLVGHIRVPVDDHRVRFVIHHRAVHARLHVCDTVVVNACIIVIITIIIINEVYKLIRILKKLIHTFKFC